MGKRIGKQSSKKRNYKKRNTRKRRRVGGMETDDEADIEVGLINDESLLIKPKPRVPFINTIDLMERGTLESPKTTTPTLRRPTPSIEPTRSSWQGATDISKENLKRYMKRGDFSQPPLTNQQEDTELLKAYYPELFKESDDEFQTPRSSISSDSYGTPRSTEERVSILDEKGDDVDPILNIYNFKSPKEREIVSTALKSIKPSSDGEEDYYSKKNIEKRKKEKKQNLKALRKEYGIDTDSD